MPPTLAPQNKPIWVQRETLTLPDTHPLKADNKFMKNNPNASFETRKRTIGNKRYIAYITSRKRSKEIQKHLASQPKHKKVQQEVLPVKQTMSISTSQSLIEGSQGKN